MAAKRGPGRPSKGGYRTKDGKRVPSVTTITGRFKESGGLIHWANQLGMEGKDYRDERDKAASAGTIVHDWAEDTLHGVEPRAVSGFDEETVEKARTGYAAFMRWWEQVDVEVLATEVPLVSEKHRYGGTFDALVRSRRDNRLLLIDHKTSNAIYEDYVIQMGAYKGLLDEHGDLVDGAQLLRYGKEYAEFSARDWTREILDKALETFLLQRKLYDQLKELKKVAA